ncbi:MAG: helix-turn-helix transcriptional regulator [Pseudomonadota bacterium]
MDLSPFLTLLKKRIDADPDLTVAGLAQKAGLDKSTIRKLIASDNKSPTLGTATKICNALGTTVERFLAEDDDPIKAEILALYEGFSTVERRALLGAARGLESSHVSEPGD